MLLLGLKKLTTHVRTALLQTDRGHEDLRRQGAEMGIRVSGLTVQGFGASVSGGRLEFRMSEVQGLGLRDGNA